jgi:hypothetical protein
MPLTTHEFLPLGITRLMKAGIEPAFSTLHGQMTYQISRHRNEAISNGGRWEFRNPDLSRVKTLLFL